MRYLERLLRKLKYGVRCDSETYLNYLRKLGMEIGERTVIFAPRFTEIDETRPWMIKIGSDVQITHGVTILTHGYDWSVLKGKFGDVLGSVGGVEIGNNVFISMNSTILKGVHIGDNVIIGAGSLVNRDVQADCVVAGNPLKVICSIDDYHKKRSDTQYLEASELVRRYREVYKKEPDDEALAEFFWLYTGTGDRYEDIPDAYKDKMRLIGNKEQSISRLENNQKMFNTKEDFLRSIT